VANSIAVELLQASHDTASFSCGSLELDTWLQRYAYSNQAAGAARTFVAVRGDRIIGYYALAAGSVERDEAPKRVAQGLARHPIPVVILARLAVDLTEQGRGLGAALLKDALKRVIAAADLIGVRALLVHAKGEQARAFYERFDFQPSPVDPLQLFLLLKDLRRNAGK
jgi:GNAT superfamily N-acetyltransferase